MIGPGDPVGIIAARFPFVVRVLEDARIDYYSAGSRPLHEACATAHVSLDGIMARLKAEAERPRSVVVDWMVAPLQQLMEHVVHGHHAFTRTLCGDIARNLEDAAQRHQDLTSLSELARLFTAFQADLVHHFDQEEAVAFPYVDALCQRFVPFSPFESVGALANILEFEHENVEDRLGELRELTDGYMPPPGASASLRAAHAGLRTLERDLHEHLHLENNVVFHRARQLAQALGR